jgi:hypothetical protein
VTEARTLPDHEQCVNHRRYRLSCQQYEQLLARAEGICEICRRPLARGPRGKLAIDHCGPQWAVRGLLCNGCNGLLMDDNTDFDGAEEYLANAWWEQQCKALGFPLNIRPEPGIGEAIRNQLGTVWVHLTEDDWEAGTQGGHHWTPLYWEELFELYGPHNLIPYDLAVAFRDGSVPPDLRYTVTQHEDWADIRAAIGAPEPIALRPTARTWDWSLYDSIPWLETPEQTAKALRFFLPQGECRQIGELLLADE